MAIDHAQGLAFAGAGDAFAAFYEKQRTMSRARNEAGAGVEKLIREPLQCHPTMRAAIFVGVYLSFAPNGQNRQFVDLEAKTFSFRQLLAVTQVFQVSLPYA